jgi:peptidoglycan-N-acetylglucosamine deacetylase
MKAALAAAVFCALAIPAAAQQIALTFDDLPSHSALPAGETRIGIAQTIIAALEAAGAPPIMGFVNGMRLVDDPASAPVLKMWRETGFPLGNHTWSHMNLDLHTIADWEADTLKNEAAIAPPMAGEDWHWLRYPNLREGETLAKHDGVRAFLARHGYRVAAVTMSFDDYLWNEPYTRCIAKGDDATVAQLEAAYLSAAAASADYYRALSQALYGHDIPYVLLMHLGAFDARMLPRLLSLYRAKGFSFVTLEQAEADPFYRASTDLAGPDGPVTLEQAMAAHGVTFAPRLVQVLPFGALCR